MPLPSNIAAIQAAWTTAKAQLAQLSTDAATVATELANIEASCDLLISLGAADVAEFVRRSAFQTRVGYQPRFGSQGAAPALPAIFAPDTTKPRDLTTVDQRPISSTVSGQFCYLS